MLLKTPGLSRSYALNATPANVAITIACLVRGKTMGSSKMITQVRRNPIAFTRNPKYLMKS